MSSQSSRVLATLILALLLLLLSGMILVHHFITSDQTPPTDRESTSSAVFRISESCLQCICEAGGSCESSAEMCRNFRISQRYWLDAGRPTLEGDVDLFGETETEYLRCVNNPFCAARTVGGYVGKHLQDCDGDGVISCYDYARIHIDGYAECGRKDLALTREQRLRRCLKEFVVK